MAIYDLDEIYRYFRREQVTERTLAAEEVLFHQGAPIHSIHFVVAGEVRVETYLEDGRSIVFFRVGQFGALGEENLSLPSYLYTGVASEETVICSIGKADFLDGLKSNQIFAQELTSCLAQRYAHALMLRELMGIKAAEDRLLTWLHWQQEESLDLKGRMGHLAPDLGLSRESVYRAVARLKEKGEISVDDGRVDLLIRGGGSEAVG